jgi:hypothetical protein
MAENETSRGLHNSSLKSKAIGAAFGGPSRIKKTAPTPRPVAQHGDTRHFLIFIIKTSQQRNRLQRLTRLRQLSLMVTRVTGAGLENLKGLRQFGSLDLSGAKVTDAGLVHLKTLTAALLDRLTHGCHISGSPLEARGIWRTTIVDSALTVDTELA